MWTSTSRPLPLLDMSEVEVRRHNSERGASVIMLALTLFLLIGSAALAVDIGATWLDRSADQKVTDSASAAGSLEALKSGPRAACETALAYVAANTDEIPSIDSSECATQFSATCAVGNVEDLSVEVGRYVITVTHPVDNGNELMTSGIVGGTPQPLVPEDGKECSRVAVEMSATRRSMFAQVLGFAQGRTTVHTVATASTGFDSNSPINLLVLDRHRCNSIRAEGNGGIIVDAVVDPDGGGEGIPGLVQGVLAADSNGSIGCGSEGVIHLQGSGSMIRADGPEGCPNQDFPPPFGGTGTVSGFAKGHGCGKIETFAAGTPGCNLPACSRNGGNEDYRPTPFPSKMTKPKTRAPVDHQYNCKADYTSIPADISWATHALTVANEQDIPGCTNPAATHIDDLIREARQTGTPPGFTNWAPTRSCTPSGTTDVPTGNWYINCPTFGISGNSTVVRIRGNVVFQGSITMGSASRLEIINTAANPGFAFLRPGGVLSKAGQSHLAFDETMVYASKSARISLSGGSGSLRWIAPNSGRFEDLALWSDFVTPENTNCSFTPTNCNNWAGQATLRMEGVFFMPLATADYSGSSGQNQTDAQWIADKLVARGSGTLTVAPSEGRQVLFPSDPGTVLIR